MAFQDIPDFSFKGQVPMAAIIEAYRRKGTEEFQMQMQAAQEKRAKQQELMQTLQMGAELTNNLVDVARQREKREANAAVTNYLGQGMQMVPTKTMTPAKSSFAPGMTEAPISQPMSETDGYKQELLSLIHRANPEEAQKALLKHQLSAAEGNNRKRFQQSTLQIPDETGQMRTYTVGFDTDSGQLINTQNQKPIKTMADLEGSLERGYAQSTRPAGFTLQGEEIVEDVRTGNKFVTSYDESGKPVKKPYSGISYPKLENAPASAIESLGSLQVAKDTLESLRTNYKDRFIGPAASRFKTVGQYVNTLTDEEQTAFKTELQSYQNAMIKAITGAQMSEPEAKRLLQQMPDDKKSPKAFMQQLDVADKITERQLSSKLRTLEAGRYVFKGISEERATELVEEKFKNITKGLPKIKPLSEKSTEELLKDLLKGVK